LPIKSFVPQTARGIHLNGTVGWVRSGPGIALQPSVLDQFFGAPDKPTLPLSFALGQFQRQAPDGGARNRRIKARMARIIAPVTATSASWNLFTQKRHHGPVSHGRAIIRGQGQDQVGQTVGHGRLTIA
jgi:hypothetical protein